MATTETIEGMIGSLWYHYDARNDVLYLRRGVPPLPPTPPTPHSTPATETYGEESDDGLIIHRAESDDAIVAITVVSWWERFGKGLLPDSLQEIAGRVESTARTLPLAA